MAASFSSSYLAGEARALALLPPGFREPEARAHRARLAAERAPVPGLVEALEPLERRLPPSAARRANLAALARPGTACVVTGQQVGLFLGPLYTFYKAASAVVAARALEREAGVRCVPVFWLQSEDHDFAEIDHCHVPRPGDEPLTLRLAGPRGSRASVKHVRLGADVAALLAALGEALDGLPHAAEVLALLGAHYREGASVVDAFAGVLAALFADEGLVLVDPREPAVARLAVPALRRALVEADAIEAALVARGRALRDAGFDEQVHVRPGAALAFVHAGGAEGPRFRPERREGGFALSGDGVRSTGELVDRLERDPLSFSTSALLRPLVQDALLPTAAYLGGPGELAYYPQIAPLYPLFGLTPPVLAPRARFRVVDDRARSLLGRLGLSAADAERPREELLRALAPKTADVEPGALEAALLGDITARLDAFEATADAIDENLGRRARRTRATIGRAVGRLAERYRRDLALRDGVTAARVDRLQAALAPGGVPQERFFSWPRFAAERGVRAFTEAVLAAVVPFDPSVRELA
jgi:bacillithiol biosynthesis cysteine-adding enzyme BshC